VDRYQERRLIGAPQLELELELEEAIDTIMAKYNLSFQTAETEIVETILTIAEAVPR
jgi:hypothetical protein